MSKERGRVAEELSTFAALVWPFPGVDSLMFDERGVVLEELATFPATVRPFCGVNPLVPHEC